MTDLFLQRVSVPDNILMRDLDAESVILDLDNENYFGLDEIGTRFWHVLIDSETIGDAYQTLLLEFNVESEQLRVDLQEYVTNLVGQNLLAVEPVKND